MTDPRPTDSPGAGPAPQADHGPETPAGADPGDAREPAHPGGALPIEAVAAETLPAPAISAETAAAAVVPGTPQSPRDVPAPPAAAVGRRSFVRSIAGESVTTAGRIAGISGALMGTMVEAARAAGDSLSALSGSPSRSGTVTSGAPSPAPWSRLPAPTPVAAAPLELAEADRATLALLRVGLLATNQPGAAPAVGVVRFVFDGEMIRIPGRSGTARTANLQRDPFASLTLIDPETGDALLLAGRTRIVYGADGREGAAEVLTACDVPLAEGWDTPDSRGEPLLVLMAPQRLFRRRASDERP